MGQGSSHQHKEGASRGETSEEAKSQHLKWLKTRFEELRDVSAGLSAETFDKLLAFPGADSIGYRWIAKHPDLKDVPALTFDNFVTIVSDSTHQTSAEFMFMLFSKDDSVLSREGPSITVVRAADGSVFAVAVDDEWRERACVWGGDACRLMRAAPSVAMSADTIKVYDDLRTRHKEHGFGFGRNPSQQDTALLWLDSSFSSATTTFCEGAADTHQTLNIDRIEVWGCGGDDALSQQDRQRKRDQLAAEQRQRAKRPGAEDWSDSVDRQLLSMAGVLTLDEQAREDVGHMRAEHKDKHHSSSSAN
ncbi:hypothetical protein PTSG_10395 [Salpingoeca rosetta]|uniref:TLDc domain-containing protein n=1 Tax=Salpingoeca rosetta (strain ATCC 50818 / BSB-021) TaxID=946362 RepID=F2UR66_SALR5|nr:uncharacterized protein PTSG_10395 [Salpingoeca rosetta]EGD80121.1 hypothetical protein PTSG_10395 [Salpingoeca rosetta]|eukprot:XP_004988446.1 hypothetical protein PTSG_10395 [Salpingoeca rosetta]